MTILCACETFLSIMQPLALRCPPPLKWAASLATLNFSDERRLIRVSPRLISVHITTTLIPLIDRKNLNMASRRSKSPENFDRAFFVSSILATLPPKCISNLLITSANSLRSLNDMVSIHRMRPLHLSITPREKTRKKKRRTSAYDTPWNVQNVHDVHPHAVLMREEPCRNMNMMNVMNIVRGKEPS